MKCGLLGSSALIAWFVASGPAFAECNWTRMTICPSCSVQQTLQMKTGESCAHQISVGGGIKGLQVTRRARSGFAAVSSNSYGYQPRPGFVGQDEFTVRIDYFDRTGRSVWADINVSVTTR